MRWIQGGAAAGTAVGLLLGCGDTTWVRVAVVVLATLATFCCLQAHRSTCVVLAFAGQMNHDTGRQRVTSWYERLMLRQRAWQIVLQTLGVAAMATLSSLLL